MAIIGKIREKSWLLVGIVGLAMFAFILTDYNKGIFGGQKQIGYGTIDGEVINPQLYEEATKNYQQADQQEYAQQGREYTLRDQVQSENKAWNAIVDSMILQKEFNSLGISVSDREFDAFLYGHDGFTVMASIAESFKDPATGLYSEKLLRKRVDELKSSSKAEEQQAWNQTKISLTLQRLQEKYFQLLNQGVYTTDLEAKEQYVAQKRIKDISFVIKRFSEIPDADIKISDDELRKYYDKNKEDVKYRVKSNARDIKYFTVDIVASKEDSTTFFKDLNTLKTNFAAQTTAKNDSIFVVKNSEWPYYVPKAGFRSENAPKVNPNFTYPAQMDSVFERAAVGTIVGPYLDKGKYRIAKVLDVDNTIYSVRHILLSAQKTDTLGSLAKQKMADSLLHVINKDNFDAFVAQYSEDPGSKQEGGKIENFIYSEMVPEFSDFAKNNPVGKIGWVKSDFGIHIIEVLEKKAGRVPSLAIIEKTLKPSSNTLDDINLLANDLVSEVVDELDKKSSLKDKADAFDTLAIKKGFAPLGMTIDEKNIQVYGMKTTFAEDRLISLAFNDKSEAGQVNLSPIKDEDRYIIAMLSVIRDKGVPSFDAAEAAMRRELMNEKKAAIFKSKMNGKTLEEVASKNNVEIQKAEVTFANPSIMGGGYDPEIVGAIFSKGLKDGMTTLPLKGRNAVYVIRVDKTIAEPATKTYEIEKQQLQGQARSSIQNDAITGLREKAEVVDNRRFLKIGIRR
ncbi:MAG: SurA N-terminal domain-containing protein [Crocinitomicaceae bacterium]|nr:SurA N-terminal domain-containing protein [Crocinitomicaceae bacterium]